MDAPMTELISARMETWIPVFISLAGLCALIVQARFSSRIQIGPAPLILALAWPLWELFQWLDDKYDTTSITGMAIPYIIFIAIGLVIGLGCRKWGKGDAAITQPEQESDSHQDTPVASAE